MIQIVEHAPHEGPCAVGAALASAGLPSRVCRTWAGDPVPETADDLVGLVVLDGPPAAHEDVPARTAERTLLRAALDAEVPVLGIGLGAHLLALAAGGGGAGERPGSAAGTANDSNTAGGGARPLTEAETETEAGGGGDGEASSCRGEPRVTPAARTDPLFADVPERPRSRLPHGRAEPLDLPAGAVPLVSCDHHHVQAFRIGASAWGTWFGPGSDATAVTTPSPHPDALPGLLARFAALVARGADRTATRAFFTRRAAGWEARFAEDGPRYAAAVERMGALPGGRVLDLGCGTARALPALRARVGAEGVVAGIDLTPAMLTAARREGRTGDGALLLADACRLPLPTGTVDGIFSAGLINHVPDPATALREWARVSAPGGVLLLFHPSGRAERAARHGRALDPDDPLAEERLRPALHAAGWTLEQYEDAPRHFLARAVRRTRPGVG